MKVGTEKKSIGIHGAQSQGRRARQEDVFAIKRFGTREALAAAADGLGGHPAGDVASREGMEEFVRHFNLCREEEAGTPRDWMAEAVHAAQRHLLKQQRNNAERYGMATTLVALYLKANVLWAASVGDSYLLRLRDGELGRLNELHGDNGGVTSAIGFNLTQIDLGEGLEAVSGDRYLLATDGIVTLDETQITSLLSDAASPEAAVTALLEAIEQQGHPYQDNTTIVAVFV